MAPEFTALLERNCDTEQGVFGRLFCGEKSWITVERPDLGNKPYISCIPPGEYRLERTTYHKPRIPYEVWELVDVPNRTLIKMHKANKALEVAGCIAMGMRRGFMLGTWAVTDSTTAFGEWMWATRGCEEGRLIIRQPWEDTSARKEIPIQ